jgi:hypothetical protein
MSEGTKGTVTTDSHNCRVESTHQGFQAQCSCGWKGVDRCRMSDDYAWTNAAEEGVQHRRNILLRQQRRAS